MKDNMHEMVHNKILWDYYRYFTSKAVEGGGCFADTRLTLGQDGIKLEKGPMIFEEMEY